MNLKGKIYLYVNFTAQRVQTKNYNYFFEDFTICHRCQPHQWCTLSTGSENLREFSKNLKTTLMGFSGDWGKLIYEKNLKSKMSWHCPFKDNLFIGLLSLISPWGRGDLAQLDYGCIIQFVLINIL